MKPEEINRVAKYIAYAKHSLVTSDKSDDPEIIVGITLMDRALDILRDAMYPKQEIVPPPEMFGDNVSDK